MKDRWKDKHNIWKFAKIPHKRQYRLYHPDTGEHPARTRPYIAARIIKEYSTLGDWVLDPMCGAGTTLVEAMLWGRNAVGIEPDPRYAEIARLNVMRIVGQTRLESPDFDLLSLDGIVLEDYAEDVLPRMIDDEEWYELITFSPPYEGINYTCRSTSGKYKGLPDMHGSLEWGNKGQVMRYYSDDPKNISNMKGDKYWEMMDEIYGLLHSLGDTMVVIVKNGIEDHKERDFAQHTINYIVDRTGWRFEQAHLAMLPYPPYWERVRRKKYPEADKVDWEHCLIFEH